MILELLLDIVIVIIPIRLTFEVTAADNNTDTHQPAGGFSAPDFNTQSGGALWLPFLDLERRSESIFGIQSAPRFQATGWVKKKWDLKKLQIALTHSILKLKSNVIPLNQMSQSGEKHAQD